MLIFRQLEAKRRPCFQKYDAQSARHMWVDHIDDTPERCDAKVCVGVSTAHTMHQIIKDCRDVDRLVVNF